MKAAVIGTTGYTGQLLLRLLDNHPEIKDIIAVSSSKTGAAVAESCRGIGQALNEKLEITGGNFASVAQAAEMKPDVVFAALPHLKSAEICEPFFGNSVVIDLSADFRIKDIDMFVESYKQQPPRPDLLQQAVYGLCEVNAEEIKKGDLIANPGCYPTCSSLPLIPLLKNFKAKGPIVINALSGISGAGKKASENLIFSERTENCNAYLPGKTHRHTNEIFQNLKEAGNDAEILFTPHLVPLKRGMIATTVLQTEKAVSESEVEKILTEAYGDKPFVQLTGSRIPESADVRGSNRIDIGWQVFDNTIMLFSTIDNLVKGASGQAVQNMNIRFGFDEKAGLSVHGNV